MTDGKTDDYVFAAPAYANAAPLAHFLGQVRPGVRVVYGRPSHLASRLIAGGADAALVPVVDCFGDAGLRMIDGPGICADGDVWSVLLKCHRPLDEVRVVACDPASKTSNALAGVLLDRHFRSPARMSDCGSGKGADAAVVIGDRALRAPPAPCGDYDLAGRWKAMTGLPFVFAVWACRADHPDPGGLRRIAAAARDAGLNAIDALAEIQARRLGLSVKFCREYLASVVHYDLGPREKEAMRLFERILCERPAEAAARRGGRAR